MENDIVGKLLKGGGSIRDVLGKSPIETITKNVSEIPINQSLPHFKESPKSDPEKHEIIQDDEISPLVKIDDSKVEKELIGFLEKDNSINNVKLGAFADYIGVPYNQVINKLIKLVQSHMTVSKSNITFETKLEDDLNKKEQIEIISEKRAIKESIDELKNKILDTSDKTDLDESDNSNDISSNMSEKKTNINRLKKEMSLKTVNQDKESEGQWD